MAIQAMAAWFAPLVLCQLGGWTFHFLVGVASVDAIFITLPVPIIAHLQIEEEQHDLLQRHSSQDHSMGRTVEDHRSQDHSFPSTFDIEGHHDHEEISLLSGLSDGRLWTRAPGDLARTLLVLSIAVLVGLLSAIDMLLFIGSLINVVGMSNIDSRLSTPEPGVWSSITEFDQKGREGRWWLIGQSPPTQKSFILSSNLFCGSGGRPRATTTRISPLSLYLKRERGWSFGTPDLGGGGSSLVTSPQTRSPAGLVRADDLVCSSSGRQRATNQQRGVKSPLLPLSLSRV
ncbi:hypothetical protein CRG98_018814 [Punica granatum]|uniref:Uncharacterized protein n=1 Tax=Punica granatum TaxID=22663 RepID=A0A2I0JX08_PUNGR|nr:hypothetical protein CRG98_018814 [Punica granatum]